MKPYKKELLLASFSIIIECALEISIPFLMNLLLNNGIESKVIDNKASYTLNLPYILMIGGVMVVFAVLSLVIGLITARYSAKTGRLLGFELRKREYQKLQEFSFRNLDRFHTNSLVTRLTNDIQIISDTCCQILRPMLRAPIQLVFALAFAVTMSARLSGVFAAILPITAAFLIVIALMSKPRFVKVQRTLDQVNRATRESLTAMRLVRANEKAGYEVEKFDAINSELQSVGVKSLGLLAYNHAVMQGMTYCCIVLILVVGGNLVLTENNARAINDMASFLSYIAQLLASLTMLSNVFLSFARSEASIARVKEVMSMSSEIKDDGNPSLVIEKGSVEFHNVSFSYHGNDSKKAVDDVSFVIEEGSFVGIIGQTGSSKSTIIHLLERFYDVDSGKIVISGHDIREYKIAELRNSISISFQRPLLFKGTIRENLLWGNEKATDDELIEALKIAEAYDFVFHKLPSGLDSPIGNRGMNVSGGQRQRLCLARAVVKKPKILILDDSFSALDRVTEANVKNNLRNCLPSMTKIVIAQKVSTIRDADQIIVLDKGRISSIGKSDFLMENDPIYKDIYHLQEEGMQNA